jgi:hypothetical protein
MTRCDKVMDEAGAVPCSIEFNPWQRSASLYLPAHFKETDVRSMQRLIEDFPLDTLVNAGASGMTANHLPFELDRWRRRIGHAALSRRVLSR